MNKLTFKIIAAILCICMILPMLAACNDGGDNTPADTPTEAPTSVPTEIITEAPTEAPEEIKTEAPTNIVTEAITEASTEAQECKHTQTEIIASVEATCAQTGLTQGQKCSDCGKIIIPQTETPKTQHIEGNIPTVDATCTEGGSKRGKVCILCGEVTVEPQVIEPLGHNYDNKADLTCNTCGEIREAETYEMFDYYGRLQKISGTGDKSGQDYQIKSYSSLQGEYPVVSGVKTLSNARLSISGFMIVADHNINRYVWSFDGVTWNNCTGGTCIIAQATQINEAKEYGVVLAPNMDCANAKYTNLYVDLINYKNMTIDQIYFAAIPSGFDDVRIPVAKITDIKVEYAIAPGPDMNSQGTGYILHAYDSLSIGGLNCDKSASSHDVNYGDVIQFNGWIGFNKDIESVGYVIDNGDVITCSPDSLRIPEETVTMLAGDKAMRFYISLDTAAITNGSHRLYFTIKLQGGKVLVLQMYTINVTGGFDDDSDQPDGEVIKAQPDKSAPANMGATVNGTTVNTGEGLHYIYLGGKFANNRFTFSGATAHEVTFAGNSQTKLARQFNRFKIRYVSTGPIKAVLKYNDGGAEVSDTVYLEAAPNGSTFTCLTLGYLSGKKASNLSSIKFYACDGGNASFLLCDVATEIYEVHNSNIKFIQNSKFRVGIKLAWGGGICYIEDRKDGIDDLFNLVNQHDTGRLIQQSYYGTKGESGDGYVMGDYNGNPWRYNPVQGGDIWNNHSRIVDVIIEKYSIYIKAQPQDWGHNGDITPSYMENIYTIYPDVIDVWNRFVDYSNYNHPKTSQELPAFYTVGYLDTFYYAVDGNPWTTPRCEPDLDFWGRNNGDGRFATSFSHTDQTWSAFTNADGSFGLGLFTPNSATILAGRFGYDDDYKNHQAAAGTEVHGYGPTKDSMSMGCSYIAPVNSFQLKCYKPVEYSYIMTTGSINQIKSTFQSHQGFASNSSIEHQGW